MNFTRRRFLQSTLHASAALAAIGLEQARGDGLDLGNTPGGKDLLAGGELVRTLRFADEDQVRYDERWQKGWDGGLTADLSALTPENLLMPNERFFIRTTAPDRLDQAGPWRIRVHGLVEVDMTLSMEDLEPLVGSQGSFVLECSGNQGAGFGLMGAASWDGVLIEDILKMVSPTPVASRTHQHGVPRLALAEALMKHQEKMARLETSIRSPLRGQAQAVVMS